MDQDASLYILKNAVINVDFEGGSAGNTAYHHHHYPGVWVLICAEFNRMAIRVKWNKSCSYKSNVDSSTFKDLYINASKYLNGVIFKSASQNLNLFFYLLFFSNKNILIFSCPCRWEEYAHVCILI